MSDHTYAYAAAGSPSAAAKRSRRIQIPLVIASCILTVSVLLFLCFGLFFSNDLYKPTWVLHFKLQDRDCLIGIKLDNGRDCYYYDGGLTYKGTYSASTSISGRDTLEMTFTMYNEPKMTMNYYYHLNGNAFIGRTLELTDLNESGFFGEGSDESSSAVRLVTDTVEENGKTYNVYSLRESNGYQIPYTPIEQAVTDPKLLGIWVMHSDSGSVDNTFSFNEDGTYQLTYRDCIFHGCYSAADGTIHLNYTVGNGTVSTMSLSYLFSDDELVINHDVTPNQYRRTDNIYAFDTGSN